MQNNDWFPMRTYYEFFAGGGMARCGLGPEWDCLFANDFDPKKVEAYSENWGPDDIVCEDVNNLDASKLPGSPTLVWASFPCQDLSLAGGGAGLKEGTRSGTFWPFWRRVQELIEDGRKPSLIALENVTGMLSSHKGKDFRAICQALADQGYRFGAIVVDAALFVPQSRKRVFVVAVSDEVSVPSELIGQPSSSWHSQSLQRAATSLPAEIADRWIWWNLPTPAPRDKDFKDVFEAVPEGVQWHTPEESDKILAMMADRNRRKISSALSSSDEVVGTAYRRTRPSADGAVQRVEVRLDGTAGCLRTPAGGSSRQIVIHAGPEGVRSRLISPREAARLMGLPDNYRLPARYNDAYHLLGDGLAVPAVSFVARELLDKLAPLEASRLKAA